MTSYIYTGQAVARDMHTCAVCGATLYVTLAAIGRTDAIPDHEDTLAARETAIQAALTADARSVRKLVRCPGCKERSIFPVAMAWLRVGLWFVAAPILPIIAPGPLEALWAIPLVLTVGGIGQLLRERSRFRRADDAVILQLSPGNRPPADRTPVDRTPVDRTPRAALPVARATKVPAAAPAPSATTPALVAAPPPPRPEASAEPRFLGGAEPEP